MTPAVAASGLTKLYGRRPALADCTLSIPPGRVVGLVGPNGAGKTTLLHLAVGLLRPTSGTIEVRRSAPIDDPSWTVQPLGLEDLVLAYMGQSAEAGQPDPEARPQEARR